MGNYNDEIRKIRFNFNETSVLDYQTLLSLAMALTKDNEIYESSKETLFQTLQVLVLVYGLEEKLADEKYVFNQDDDLNNLNYWIYLLVSLYKDLEGNSNLLYSNDCVNIIKYALTRLDMDLKSEASIESAPLEAPVVEETTTAEEYVAEVTTDGVDLGKLNRRYLDYYVEKMGLVPYHCACCGIDEWQNKPIRLRVSHGPEGLVFLCPNCFSQIGK